MPHLLSTRLANLRSSPIREILSVASQADMISFAGGLPAFSTLPDPNVLTAVRDDFQYGPSEGEPSLRSWIASDLQKRGLDVSPEDVIILSGSQQGIDLVAKLVVDSGSRVAVESPTYLAALQVFSLFGAEYVPYAIHHLDALPAAPAPSMLYCIPTFQNPSAHVYSDTQRRALACACDDLGMILFEDDPYRDLVYEGCDRTPVASYVKRSSWVYQSSFSKTLAPGLRLGYLVSSPDLHRPLLQLKQAADLHSNRISQRIVLEMLNDPDAAARMHRVREEYRHRRDTFNRALRKHFGELGQWNTPMGGLFFWVKLHGRCPLNLTRVLPASMAAGVAFMPGEPFFAENTVASGCLRLSFGTAPVESFDQGLSILADVIRDALQNASLQDAAGVAQI